MGGSWPLAPLGDLTENLDARRVPVREADRRPGPYPYYGASGVVDWVDDYIFDGEYLLVAEDGENLRTRNTPVAFLARDKFWVNNHAHIVRASQSADTRYLMYAMSVTDIGGYLSGSTMPKLTQANLNRIPIPAPPLPTQQAIAAVLGAFDDKIDLNRRMSETLEAVARALFKSWFVDFDPVRANAEGRSSPTDAVARLFPQRLNESEIGAVPDGWEVRTISDLAEVVGGTTPRTNEPAYWDDGIHCFATPKDLSALTTPVLRRTERRITDLGLDQIGSGLLPPGTVLMSSRAPIGYLAIAEVPIAVNQGFIAMKPRHGVPAQFLLRWAASAQEEVLSRANGSTFLEISKANFRPIRLAVPPEPVMRAYQDLADPLYRRVVLCESKNDMLASARDALLPRLISGELRVPDAERIAVEAGA